MIKGKGVGKAAANFVIGRLPFGTTMGDLAKGQVPVLNKLGVKSGEKVSPQEMELYPETFMDNIKMGVPGWREEVIKKLYDEKYAEKPEKSDGQLDEEERAKDKTEEKTDIFMKEHPKLEQ